jgi:hypothetical protein
MCVSIGLFVYLITQMSAPTPDPEEATVDDTPAASTVDDDYVPSFNTSGDTDWHWGFCLIVTMGAGILTLAAPKCLKFSLRCIIRLRHGRDALVHNENNEDKESPEKKGDEDEEA